MARLALFGLILSGLIVFANNVSAAEEAAQPAIEQQPSVLQQPDAGPPMISEAQPAATPDPEARGLDLNEDGTLTAKVTFIESGTLKLRAIAGATVSFVQSRSVVAQARTDQDGHFTVPGLKAWGTYSVFVTHPEWFAAFGTYVRPFAAPTDAQKPVAEKARKVNQLAFTSDTRLAQTQDLMAAGGGSPVQAVPMGDMQSFMGQQQGPVPQELGGAPAYGPGGMGGGMGGGGGGMGGGGGGIGGIGGALGAVGLAIGVAALADEDQNEPTPTSPFKP